MTKLFATILKWLTHKLGLLLLILVVLLVGAWLKDEWQQLSALRGEIERQQTLLATLRADLAAIDDAIAADTAVWRDRMQAATRPLLEELDTLSARIARAEPKWQEALRRFADLERQSRAARDAAAAARARADALEADLYWWDSYLNPAKVAAVEAARARQAVLEANARTWEAARRRAAPAVAKSPLASLYGRRSTLVEDISRLTGSTSPRHEELTAQRQQREQEVASLQSVLAAQRERVARDPRQQLMDATYAQLPLALAILMAALLAPVVIKAFLYFVVAPLAGRMAPIQILEHGNAAAVPAMAVSAVSVPLEIEPGQELLVHPDFLQSSSQPARKRTQWFLNYQLPFASLASGMFALTRIQPENGHATRVVVSSQQDAFGEVGVLELPEGASMVLQPRALAGVVKPQGTPVAISRHWRLGSLHAWLTLQLRYLVFHGPCQLILKGCRGVRAEAPQADQPRLINQAATLGFSANLQYRNTRCETFISYLRGKEDLFNDLFAGGPGRFVYEEMPAGGRRSGITGRGLEGLTDAVLKVFGI